MLYFMNVINLQLMTIYFALLIAALVYGFVWQQLYDRKIKANLVIDAAFLKALHIPGYCFIALYGFKISIPYVPEWFLNDLSLKAQSFSTVFPIGFIVLVVWVFNHTLTNVQSHIITVEKNEKFPNASAWITACKFGRVISILMFVIALMYHLKIPMTQFLAPTAIGGLAITFASKDLLANVFGGLMVMTDRPFSVGDFVAIGKNEVGTVRYIGWRTTLLQLMNGRMLHVPNGLITNSVVTNYSEKTHWFVQKEFGIRFNDFEIAPQIAAEITKWLTECSDTNKRRASFAHVFELDESSVVIRVRVYLKNHLNSKQWYEFTEMLLIKINEIVKKHKADFAFPTRTVITEKSK